MDFKKSTFGIEFTFKIGEKDGTKKHRFYRELYGWKSHSNFGKYLYVKEGILSGLRYLKPAKSVILVSVSDAKILRKFFKKYKVVFNEKIVLLNRLEAKILKLKFDSEVEKIYEELKGTNI